MRNQKDGDWGEAASVCLCVPLCAPACPCVDSQQALDGRAMQMTPDPVLLSQQCACSHNRHKEVPAESPRLRSHYRTRSNERDLATAKVVNARYYRAREIASDDE